MKRRKYKGCDEDCFHCKYPDCLKPTHKIKRGWKQNRTSAEFSGVVSKSDSYSVALTNKEMRLSKVY